MLTHHHQDQSLKPLQVFSPFLPRHKNATECQTPDLTVLCSYEFSMAKHASLPICFQFIALVLSGYLSNSERNVSLSVTQLQCTLLPSAPKWLSGQNNSSSDYSWIIQLSQRPQAPLITECWHSVKIAPVKVFDVINILTTAESCWHVALSLNLR